LETERRLADDDWFYQNKSAGMVQRMNDQDSNNSRTASSAILNGLKSINNTF
jgi:hypothetical protein